MSFQTPLRRSGRSKSAVVSRPSRHVAVEEGQQWNTIHIDCDRCVSQTSLVRYAKEQVRSLVGDSLYTVAKQRGTEHIVNRSGHRIFEPAVTEVAKRARCASFSDAQRRNENEHCREVQSDPEDTYVALFHQNPVSSIRRCPAGLHAIVQRQLSTQYRYGSVRSDHCQS